MRSLWVICCPLPLEYPKSKIKDYWCSVETHFGTRLRYCWKHFCLEWLPLVRLWVNVPSQPLPFLKCNARSRWCFVEARIWDILAMLLQQFSCRKVADSSMIVQCCYVSLAFSRTQGRKLLTLCWCSWLRHSCDVGTTKFYLARRAIIQLWLKDAAKPSHLSIRQCQISLTLHGHWFLDGRCDIVCGIFTHKCRQ